MTANFIQPTKGENEVNLSPIQQAYALLWRARTCDSFGEIARNTLREELSPEEERDAIDWVLARYGHVTREEVIAEIERMT